jgi:hypothetical protein
MTFSLRWIEHLLDLLQHTDVRRPDTNKGGADGDAAARRAYERSLERAAAERAREAFLLAHRRFIQ